ncbi:MULTISPECIES: helix-turn-helix domain-containing protein [Sphingobacterium]|uniref:helix-turn-helix domain-containing protein n=1 Tax=Sphingobacterium TaxID=28453 RepID=UPI001053F24F|nr:MULTISPECIES: helix-turn-helix transcriptional regulator [Sphingobacterium]MCW2260325.1 transcriptional regulator with XRE-family HTH domain [Sphingobacterium kitahiroshimense]TCR05401.1 helix-turn-helix protein [Sphingobacterium sp. JUb78]
MITESNDNEIFTTIGKNLHTVRHSLKLTLEAVASEIDVTYPVLSKIENGRYLGLSIGLLKKLCNYYKITIAQVLDIEGHQIFNYSQYINQPAGNHSMTNNIADGYELAIQSLKEQIEYLKNQNQDLLNKLLNTK